MKKTTLISIIIGLALIIGGAALLFISLDEVDFDFREYSTMVFEEKKHEISEEFSAIDIRDVEADIIITESDDDLCTVACMDSSSIYHKVEVEDGALTITRVDDRTWFERIGFYWEDIYVTVALPEAEYEQLKLKSVSGSINCTSNGVTFKDAELQSTSGSICFDADSCDKITAETVSGDIDLSCKDTEAVDIKSTSGNIELNETAAVDVYIKTTSGEVGVFSTKATEECSIDTVSGDISFADFDAGELTLNSTSGDIEGSLLSPKNFTYHTTSGDFELPKSDPDAGVCKITTTSGDAEIDID